LRVSVFTGGKCPFGQIPLLEVEGVTLCQSMAILRFVARRYGMYQFFMIWGPIWSGMHLKNPPSIENEFRRNGKSPKAKRTHE